MQLFLQLLQLGLQGGHAHGGAAALDIERKYRNLDENGKEQYMIMGCYGIGVSRTLSAVVEQNCDDKGMVWPEDIAPYKLEIVVVNMKDETQRNVANDLYETLNIDDSILIDDRNETFGVKLNDAELIGIPYVIIVGRGAKDGQVELIRRATLESVEISIDDFVKNYENLIKGKIIEMIK